MGGAGDVKKSTRPFMAKAMSAVPKGFKFESHGFAVSRHRGGAHDALALVRELHGFVARNRGAYLEESDDADATRDDIETEVRLSVQACQAHVEMLKSTVQARAAGKEDTPQTVAHLHGVVLIVTERLAKVAGERELVERRVARLPRGTSSRDGRCVRVGFLVRSRRRSGPSCKKPLFSKRH